MPKFNYCYLWIAPKPDTIQSLKGNVRFHDILSKGQCGIDEYFDSSDFLNSRSLSCKYDNLDQIQNSL